VTVVGDQALLTLADRAQTRQGHTNNCTDLRDVLKSQRQRLIERFGLRNVREYGARGHAHGYSRADE
jgi:hypothetical protein